VSRLPPGRAAAIAVAAVALLVVASGLGNGFAYDDVALLVQDPRLHSLHGLGARLTEPYWPSGLYRPVTLAVLGAEWAASGGSALAFRVVSSILYAGVCLAVLFLVLRAGAPRWAALLGALVFAVHPIHSEVTANVVGQAELLSTGLTVAAVWWYLRARAQPGVSWGDALGVTALFLLAANAKESGYVIPGLLVAAELLVVREAGPWAARLLALRAKALLLVAAALGSLAVRSMVLGGIGGETPHLSLDGLSLPDRAIAMLAVIPEWGRLLIWPVHLQAEYGPPGLVPATEFGLAHLHGLGLLVGVTALVAWGWRRAPLVSFGLVWIVIALAPVSNVVFPSGILLAERTLFLPSVGLAILAAGLARLAGLSLVDRPVIQRPALAAVALILAMAGVRSAARQPAWRDTLTILEQTTLDAPLSYRAQLLLGKEQLHRGHVAGAEAAFRRAGELWAHDPRPFEELGQLLRARGDCQAAIPVLEAGVRADSTADTARGRLVECLIKERRWDAAESEVQRGLAQGVSAYGEALRRIAAGRGERGAPSPGIR